MAAANPHAWLREPRTAEELTTPTEANRMIAYPYTKLITANLQVDQGAAVILCSAAAAEAAGVPRDRWVFPLAGGDAEDHWFLSHRADFHSSPAIRLAGALGPGAGRYRGGGRRPRGPLLVLPLGRRDRGGRARTPRRDHPAADRHGRDDVRRRSGQQLRQPLAGDHGGPAAGRPGTTGLTTGLGWYVSRHSIGVYGTAPSTTGVVDPGALPEGTVVESAAGFAWADPQVAVGPLPQCASDADARGEVTVETYSVEFGRPGAPERAVVACRTLEGRRAWANVTDPDQLAVLVTEEGCGRLGTLRADGEVDLR